MRELFTIDKKNYILGGNVGRRPSIRGIIIKNEKIAMMHSIKYEYYKLPGGGIEPGEEHEDTLIREVREESGLIVIRKSIREFGYVRRIEKGLFDDIFIQDNYYYLCNVESNIVEQELDDYEAEEKFSLEFMNPLKAISINENSEHFEKEKTQVFSGMLERENKVLKILVEEYKNLK